MQELADKHNLSVPFDTRVSLLVKHPIVFHLQRTGVDKPRVLVAYDFVLPIFDSEMRPKDREAWLKDFTNMALRTLRAAQSLGRRSCLVTGDLAYEMRHDRQAMRRAAIEHDMPLHDRYFSTTVTATVRCEISGREHVIHATPETLEHAVHTAKVDLSRLLLLDKEDSDLVDLLEGMREGKPSIVPVEVIVKEIDWGNQTIIRYEGHSSGRGNDTAL